MPVYSPQPDNNWAAVSGGMGYGPWTVLGGASGGGTYMEGVGIENRQVDWGGSSYSFAVYAGSGSYAISRPLLHSLTNGGFQIVTRFDVSEVSGSNLVSIRTGNDTSSFSSGELLSFGIAQNNNQLCFTDATGSHTLPSGEARGDIWVWEVFFDGSGNYNAFVFNASGGYQGSFTGSFERTGASVGSFAVINASPGDNQNVIFDGPLFVPNDWPYEGYNLQPDTPVYGPQLLVPIAVWGTNDSGYGSLRYAISQIESGSDLEWEPYDSGGEPQFPSNLSSNVVFGPSVTGTITLTNGGLLITNNLIVSGPGAAKLTIDGSRTNSIFTITNGNVNISGLTIAHGLTGVISSNATVTLSNCFITGHTSHGILNDTNGTMILKGCTIASNVVAAVGAKGGGIYNASVTSTLVMTNCTVSSNTCFTTSGTANGGGIYSAGPLTMISCTICSNALGRNSGELTFGGGVSASTLTIGNTIIAGNKSITSGSDVQITTVTSLGYSLIGATNGSSAWVPNDLLGNSTTPLDPKLGPLLNNGGPTPTHALLTGGPAIDAGKSFGLANDQRGSPRPVIFSGIVNGGDGSDIGAFEVQQLALDIVLRIYDGASIIKIAAQPGSPTSPLRVNKNVSNYGIFLVPTNDPNASRVRIQTSSGVKALEKLP